MANMSRSRIPTSASRRTEPTMRHRSRCFFLLALLIALRLGAQLTSAGTQEPTAPSTREMGAILREIYLKQDWKTDPNKSDQRAAYYRAVLKRSLALSTEITIRQALAQELLNAVDSAGAIN